MFRQSSNVLIVLATSIVVFGQGCTGFKSNVGISNGASVKSEATSEDALLILVTRAENYSQQLQMLNDEGASQIATDLDRGRSKIVELMQAKILGSWTMRQQVDLLSSNIIRAVETLLRLEINRVERESVARDADLTNRINVLTDELGKFRSAVNSKFLSIENQIASLNERLTALDDAFKEFRTATIASAAALSQSIADVKQYTKEQITQTREVNSKLKEELVKQQATLDQLFNAENDVAGLQAKLCQISTISGKTDTRPVCTGALGEDPTKCCLTIDAVNCTEVFPNEIQVAARNQCNIIVQSIKNHDAQLKAINEVDKKQTELIEGLLKDVADLDKRQTAIENQVSILQESTTINETRTIELVRAIQAQEQRLVILEFKAARAEAASSLNERSDLTLAWIARRTADISNRFCSKNKEAALHSFDYQAARQNWAYCKERLEWLTRAKEMTTLATAYTAGLQSINVDSNCNATINGQSAESLTNAQLTDPLIFDQVTSKCTTGGPVLARAMLINIIQLQNRLGPDFRTVAYMAKKAKIAQLLTFGKEAKDVTATERASFEQFDPTSDALKNTPYGQIERTFKKHYGESRMRTVAGTFPESPATIPASIAGFDEVYSHSEIETASTPYLARVKGLELEGACADCGWKVAARNVTNRDGKARYAFPKDRESLCPIINDDVVLKNTDGKYYAYRLNYNGFEEDFKPVLSNDGAHNAFASSDAALASGATAGCGYYSQVYKNGLGQAYLHGRKVIRLTTPWGNTYAGRGNCVKATVVCMTREGEYTAPAGSKDFVHHLNGFATADLEPRCKFNMGRYSTVRSREVYPDEISHMRAFAGPVDDVTRASLARATEVTTQLGSNYWMWQDGAVAYGVNNQLLSKDTPFYVAPNARSTPAVREHYRVTTPPQVQECTPSDEPTTT